MLLSDGTRRISVTLLAVACVCPTGCSSQILDDRGPSVHSVTDAMSVAVCGSVEAFYELHIRTPRDSGLTLHRVEVSADSMFKHTISVLSDAALAAAVVSPAIGSYSLTEEVDAGFIHAVVFMQVPVAEPRPRALFHRLHFSSSSGARRQEIDGPHVSIGPELPPVLAAPLTSGRWLAANGISNTSGHRRAFVVRDGQLYFPTRFATDWIRLDDRGEAFCCGGSRNSHWYGHGAEALAVKDAVVVAVRDGIPDNDPWLTAKEAATDAASAAGNFVVLEIGGGVFALYAHLQSSSIRVRPGQRVRQGGVIGLVGNSGNSDVPHLHFQVTRGSDALVSQGLPYVLDAFRSIDMTRDRRVPMGICPPSRRGPHRAMEIPVENSVVQFWAGPSPR